MVRATASLVGCHAGNQTQRQPDLWRSLLCHIQFTAGCVGCQFGHLTGVRRRPTMSSESHDPGASLVPIPPQGPSSSPGGSPSRWWPRWVAPPNPFYLFSAACVIHSTGLSVSGAVKDLPPLVTSSLVGGYLLLLAFVGVIVVRKWKVWDDARSILLTLPLLMLELTISFDKLLVDAPRFWAGMVLLLAALCIGLSQAIIRLLNLKLPAMYRIPFYLQLVLMISAAAVPANLITSLSEEQIRWVIVAASPVWALLILTLLPAVRAGAGPVQMKHVPWIWPYYPWSLLVIVWLCLGFRLWTLSLSFDAATSLNFEAAMQMQNSFLGPFIFVPPLMAISLLALEAAIKRQTTVAKLFAIGLPAACVGLSVWSPAGNVAATEFVSDLTRRIGPPAWGTVWLALGASAIGAARGVAECRRMAIIYLALLSVVSSETTGIETEFVLRTWPLWLLAVGLMFVGLIRRTSKVFLEGTLWGIAASVAAPRAWDGLFSTPVLVAHLAVVAVIGAGLAGRDPFAAVLRTVGAWLPLLALPVGLQKSLGTEWAWWGPILYLCVATTPLALIGASKRWRWYRKTAITLATGAYLVGYIETGQYLYDSVHWRGSVGFLWGLVLLHAAVAFSAFKGRTAARVVASPQSGSSSDTW